MMHRIVCVIAGKKDARLRGFYSHPEFQGPPPETDRMGAPSANGEAVAGNTRQTASDNLGQLHNRNLPGLK
jgi:hypothetical protein